jgi:hypothetical protein
VGTPARRRHRPPPCADHPVDGVRRAACGGLWTNRLRIRLRGKGRSSDVKPYIRRRLHRRRDLLLHGIDGCRWRGGRPALLDTLPADLGVRAAASGARLRRRPSRRQSEGAGGRGRRRWCGPCTHLSAVESAAVGARWVPISRRAAGQPDQHGGRGDGPDSISCGTGRHRPICPIPADGDFGTFDQHQTVRIVVRQVHAVPGILNLGLAPSPTTDRRSFRAWGGTRRGHDSRIMVGRRSLQPQRRRPTGLIRRSGDGRLGPRRGFPLVPGEQSPGARRTRRAAGALSGCGLPRGRLAGRGRPRRPATRPVRCRRVEIDPDGVDEPAQLSSRGLVRELIECDGGGVQAGNAGAHGGEGECVSGWPGGDFKSPPG